MFVVTEAYEVRGGSQAELDRRASAKACMVFQDAAAVGYARVDFLNDALPRSERCIGRGRTPC